MQVNQIKQRFQRHCVSKKQTENNFKNTVFILVSAFALFCSPVFMASNATAAPLEKDKLSAVISVINFLLLDEDISQIQLGLNDSSNQPYLITDKGFTATFHRQNIDLEFCFKLSSAQIQLTINGVLQTSNNSVSTGENCYTIPHSQQIDQNEIVFQSYGSGSVSLTDISLQAKITSQLGLTSLTRSSWDEKAVRKVLRIFAFGGHAIDAQIQQWADMKPRVAITEMLNFNQHNLKLSPIRADDPYKQTASQYGEFTDFVNNYLANPASNLPISVNDRKKFAIGDGGYAFDDTIQYMITTRGLNPFRQMVGFWETNYHLATNLDSNVNNFEMAEYYDVIMRAHESGVPYQKVLGAAAKTAAAASQYGHENNEWINGFCFCNQDFAREIHQLYYGIFGVGDEEHHENVTIPNTASMLTGMRTYIKVVDPRFPNDFPRRFRREYVNYITPDLAVHHGPALNILRKNISGSGPFQKIDALMEHSIEHPESLKNLPVMIISVIADDSLDEAAKQQLRAAWASMGSNKQFLTFIHAYAISDLFHGPKQRKYLSSFWRMYTLANKFNTHNIESFQAGQDSGRMGRPVNRILDRDDAQSFRPTKNVFGSQTGLEAADSAKIFEDNFNEASKETYLWMKASGCDDCDQGSPWHKNWGAEIPLSGGQHKVTDVAAWLWKHMVGSLDNYTALERSQLIAILGATNNESRDQGLHFDLSFFLCIYNDRVSENRTPNDVATLINRSENDCRISSGYDADEIRWFNKSYNTQELTGTTTSSSTYNPAISNGVIPSLINGLGQLNMPLLSDDDDLRENANRRIHYAMAFISATPFMLVESGE